MWKQHDLVILHSNEKAKIGEYALMLNSATGISSYLSCGIIQREEGYNIKCEKQHLYFLSSDEEIKEGDWFYYKHFGEDIISQAKETTDLVNLNKSDRFFKKILASTDSSLGYEESIYDPRSKTGGKWIGLPQIPQSFIEHFVSEYNKGYVITKVMIEYVDNGCEDWIGDDYGGEPFWNEKIELDVNLDNTINIKTTVFNEEKLGEEISKYCKKYENTNKYNDVMKAIEFGYQLALKTETNC